MLSCFRYRRLLLPYVEGELEAGARRKLEAHLRRCSACTRDASELRQVGSRIREAESPAVIPSQDLWNSIRSRIETPHSYRRPWWQVPGIQVASTAGIATVVLLAVLAVHTPEQPKVKYETPAVSNESKAERPAAGQPRMRQPELAKTQEQAEPERRTAEKRSHSFRVRVGTLKGKPAGTRAADSVVVAEAPVSTNKGKVERASGRSVNGSEPVLMARFIAPARSELADTTKEAGVPVYSKPAGNSYFTEDKREDKTASPVVEATPSVPAASFSTPASAPAPKEVPSEVKIALGGDVMSNSVGYPMPKGGTAPAKPGMVSNGKTEEKSTENPEKSKKDTPRSSPSQVSQWCALADKQQGRLDDEITDREKQAKDAPENARNWLALGKAYLNAGNRIKARDAFKKAVEFGDEGIKKEAQQQLKLMGF